MFTHATQRGSHLNYGLHQGKTDYGGLAVYMVRYWA